MIKKTITFTDFAGEQRTEDHYFNLSKAELVEWNLMENNKLFDTLTEISESNDGAVVVPMFKKILGKSYGVVSEDGRRFIKRDGAWEEFLQTGAWDELILELLNDADTASAFINGLIPTAVLTQAQAESDRQVASAESVSRPQPQDRLAKQVPTVKTVRTPAELVQEKATPERSLVESAVIGSGVGWADISPEDQRRILAQLGGGNTDGSIDRPLPDGLSRPPHESGIAASES